MPWDMEEETLWAMKDCKGFFTHFDQGCGEALAVTTPPFVVPSSPFAVATPPFVVPCTSPFAVATPPVVTPPFVVPTSPFVVATLPFPLQVDAKLLISWWPGVLGFLLDGRSIFH